MYLPLTDWPTIISDPSSKTFLIDLCLLSISSTKNLLLQGRRWPVDGFSRCLLRQMGQWWLRDWRVGAHLQRCVGDFWRSVRFVVFMSWLLSVLMICLGYAEGMELYKTRRWKIFPSSARQCFVLPSQQCSPNARSHALRRRVIQKLKMKEAEAMQVLLLVLPLNSKVPLSACI